jgi:hypothetical protein
VGPARCARPPSSSQHSLIFRLQQYRRVKCVRSGGESGACDGCIRKGVWCLLPFSRRCRALTPPTSRIGIQCSMEPVGKCTWSPLSRPEGTDPPSTAATGRTGARIETAKQLFGSLSSSTSTALVPSGTETRLANDEMSETLGLELLSLYSDSSASDPLFPPPVFDSVSLRGRFEAVCVHFHPFGCLETDGAVSSSGRKLSHLSNDDQVRLSLCFRCISR